MQLQGIWGKWNTDCSNTDEPIMLKILPIFLLRISSKSVPLFFFLFLYLAYYSTIILNMK